MKNNTVAVALVTFNRLEKLKIALNCYDQQTYPIEEIVVVDNCSSDDTHDYLMNWMRRPGKFKKKVITLRNNLGGAGGFGVAMDTVLTQVKEGQILADWVLVSDDDAFPEIDAIEKMLDYYQSKQANVQNQIVSLCSAVKNHGNYHLAHRSRVIRNIMRVRFVGVAEEEYEKDGFDIDLFSYVGSMIKINALLKVGTTNKELFIYGDDNEHSLRLRKIGRIICVPKSIYNHDTVGVEARSIGWYNYYNRRNQLYILKKYFPNRYFFVRIIKRYLVDISIFSKNSKEERKLFRVAQNDAICDRLGEHKIYRPGYKLRGK